jgi:tRNA nucleotidyltransferase (CCA-adding enzyme)
MASLDMDIVIEGNAIAFAQRMQSLYGGRIVPHRRFNTAKWILDDHDHPVDTHKLLADLNTDGDTDGNIDGAIYDLPAHLDFVTARTEFYTAPTVLPTVEDSSIKLDLHRRDFTINTLALCLNPNRWGELLDFWGGVNDLNHGIIRVLHSLSFVDDPTRILRAVRYEQRFDFVIEPRTLELLRDAVELLDRVTPARIRHELERILQEDQPEKDVARLQELGVLARIHPALTFDATTAEAFARLRTVRGQPQSDEILRKEPLDRLYWGVLVSQRPQQVHGELTERLGLRGETQQLMRGLAHLRQHLAELEKPGLAPSRIVAIFDSIDPVALALLPVIYPSHLQALDYAGRYRSKWRSVHPELSGHDLAELGIAPGPIYAELLRTLREGRLDGILLTRDDEIAYVRSYLQLP